MTTQKTSSDSSAQKTARQVAESCKPIVGLFGKMPTAAIASGILAAIQADADDSGVELTQDRQNEIIKELHSNVSKLDGALAAEIKTQADEHWAKLAKEKSERGPFVARITDPYFRKKAKEQNKASRIASCIEINGGDFNYKKNTWLSCNALRQLMSLSDEQRAELLELASKADDATAEFDRQHNL